MYRNTSSIESWIYNDIDCQFAICEKCFWSATVFRSAERRNTNNINRDKRILHSCPICSSGNISLIAITNGIFRK